MSMLTITNPAQVSHSQPMFGDHDKTCCWLNGLYSDDASLNGLAGAEEKEEGDMFEGGWLRTAAIAAGAGVGVFAIAYLIEKSRGK